MKLSVFFLFVSMLFSYSGYSGLYFEKGLSLEGSHISMDSDGDEEESGFRIGFSYLENQATIENPDRPTLFKSGILELSGFYSEYSSSLSNSSLEMKQTLGGLGLNFHIKNLKFGYNYESYINVSAKSNGENLDLDVFGNRHMFCVGISQELMPFSSNTFKDFKGKIFLDYNIASGELAIEMSGIQLIEDSFKDSRATIIGLGLQKNNFVIQPSIMIPKGDADSQLYFSFIYKL
tara:strand:+ start:29 stop:730 length:702 start_codon:yes stop_codon:yes gene_type:complete